MLPRTIAAALLAACLGFAPAPVYRERPPTGLLREMIGRWGGDGDVLVITKDRWVFHRRKGLVDLEWRMKLDPDQTPATFDIQLVSDAGERAEWVRGIVKVEGDTLTYAFCHISDADRPKSFDPSVGLPGGLLLTRHIYERAR